MNELATARLTRRLARVLGLAAMLALPTSFATAQPYPSKVVKLYVPFGAGGVSDTVGRIVAQGLTKDLGQNVIVINAAGGSGMIASGDVAKARPDGYALLLTTNVHVINPALRKKMPYDSVADFTPLAKVATTPLMLVVNGQSPIKSVADYLKAARAHPGELTFASSGIGTSPHLAGEQFAQATHTTYSHIPYNVSAAVTQAVVAGDVASSWSGVQAATPFIKSGKMRALAIASDKRSKFVPEVPTLAELGIKGVNIETWFGLFGPAGLPADIGDRISKAVLTSLGRPETIEALAAIGVEPAGLGPAQFKTLVVDELQMYAKLAAAVHISVE